MLKVGIVGLPNVGKSTLFNSILKREQALSANYPFATIEPNVGIVDVVDRRLDRLAELVAVEEDNTLHPSGPPPSKGDLNLPPIIYPTIEFVDIAGLVKGANEGEGLGNKFLANIREVDMIIQVVRDFKDKNIVREHSTDPDTDTEVINNELILKDIESIEKKIDSKHSRPSPGEEKVILNKYLEHLNEGGFAIDLRNMDIKTPPALRHSPERQTSLSQGESFREWEEYIKPLQLLTDKKMVYVFNVDENDSRLKDTTPNLYKENHIVYISAKLESELSSLSGNDQQAYLKDLGIQEPGLDKITRLCYSTLGLISFFTAGEKEVKGWEIKKGSTALEAAGKIHTDFMKNFIKAEIISYEDYIEHKTRLNAKNAGKLRLEGKDYIVKDGDVIEFKVGA